MPIAMGVFLALAVCAYTMAMRMDRDRALYPVMLIVVASYYVLFAVMAGCARAISVESLIAGGFIIASGIGFRRNLWVTAAGLAAHGVLDSVHAGFVTNPGVPAWWPAFCLAFDVTAAAYLAWLLLRPTTRLGAPSRSAISARGVARTS